MQSFEEFMQLAAGGDHRNVDWQIGDLSLTSVSEDKSAEVYSDFLKEMAPEGTVFFLGKVANDMQQIGMSEQYNKL